MWIWMAFRHRHRKTLERSDTNTVLHLGCKKQLLFPHLCLSAHVCSWQTFFTKFLEDINPFYGATDVPVLDFWWRLLWLDRGICVTHSLRFTSGATPTDLFAASMAAELFSSTYLGAGTGGAQNRDLSCCHSQSESSQSYASSACSWQTLFGVSQNSVVWLW